jgi:hypothetical protein
MSTLRRRIWIRGTPLVWTRTQAPHGKIRARRLCLTTPSACIPSTLQSHAVDATGQSPQANLYQFTTAEPTGHMRYRELCELLVTQTHPTHACVACQKFVSRHSKRRAGMAQAHDPMHSRLPARFAPDRLGATTPAQRLHRRQRKKVKRFCWTSKHNCIAATASGPFSTVTKHTVKRASDMVRNWPCLGCRL